MQRSTAGIGRLLVPGTDALAFGMFRLGRIKSRRHFMLALIFTIQALSLLLVLQERKRPAIVCFWLSLAMTIFWFGHHATDSLGISL
jgi:hypothetical protein